MKTLKVIFFLFAVTCTLPTFAAIACRPGLNNCPVKAAAVPVAVCRGLNRNYILGIGRISITSTDSPGKSEKWGWFLNI